MAESKDAPELGALLSEAQIRSQLTVKEMIERFKFPEPRFEWGGKSLWNEKDVHDWMMSIRLD